MDEKEEELEESIRQYEKAKLETVELNEKLRVDRIRLKEACMQEEDDILKRFRIELKSQQKVCSAASEKFKHEQEELRACLRELKKTDTTLEQRRRLEPRRMPCLMPYITHCQLPDS